MRDETHIKIFDGLSQHPTFGQLWHEASLEVQTCVVRSTLHVLRGKWKLLIISLLLDGPRRYGELKASLPEASEKMLIQHLKELEQDCIVQRTAYPEIPPRVEYQLTEHGKRLRPFFEGMLVWGRTYLSDSKVLSRGACPENSCS